MPKCPKCEKDDIRVILRKNPVTVYECENGHLFERKREPEKGERKGGRPYGG